MGNGKFINTNYHDSVDSIVKSMKKVVNNPHYKWTDMSPTPTNYFNQNKEMSTLDEGSKLQYDDIGVNSPTKYNKIENLFIYGLEQIQVNLVNDDFGVESSSIEGDGVILPNTIIPYPGDFFQITYLKEKKLLFKINDVSYDTLENGSNIYKISYKIETSIGADDLDINIKDNYTFLVNNVGTGFNPVIRKESYIFIEKMDSLTVTLKKYYKSIFYNSRVQTFTFKFLEEYFYDPFMIEFMINNRILEGDGEYIHLMHQTNVGNLFPVRYDRTFFKCIEEKDIKSVRSYKVKAIGQYIDDMTTIFDNRPENYFEICYDLYNPQFNNVISCFKDELINGIESHTFYNDENSVYNIIIKFLYNEDITDDDVNTLKHLDYCNNETLYYAIPIIIYCLEEYIRNCMRK